MQVNDHSTPSRSMAQSNGVRLGGSTVHPPFEDDLGHYASLNPVGVEELSPSHQAALKGTDESQGNSSTVTSDTEYGGKQAGKRKKKPWKPNSDMSTTTGPHSTETSDVETSANEQSSEVTQKGKHRKLTTLLFGLTFGSKNKEKSKDKAKNKTKDKGSDSNAKQSTSRFFAPTPGTLKKPSSEPNLAEAEEPVVTPVRAAITPDMDRHHKLDAEPQPPVSEAVVQVHEGPQQQAAGEKVDAVTSDSVPSMQSSIGGIPRFSRGRTIQERIAILQQHGVRTESDSDSQGVVERPAHSPVPLPHPRTRLPSAEEPEARSSRVMKAIQIFEGHSTHSSGQAQPRKSLGQDVGETEKGEGSDRKSSNSSANSSDASVSGPVKTPASPQSQPESKQEEKPEPTTAVEDTATADSPPLEQDLSLEITVKSPSGCEDLQPPAVPLKHSRSPGPPLEDEEEMKVFAKLQAAAARARKDQPPVPAPYREGKKVPGAERSQQTMPSKGSQTGKVVRSAYTLPAERRGTGSRSPSPPPVLPSLNPHSPARRHETFSSQEQDQGNMNGAAARPKTATIPNGIELPAEQQSSSNSLSQSEPNFFDGPSSPPAIPTRQESRVVEKTNTSPYRTLTRHAATNLTNRAASVDSCLDERSSKSLSPQQVASARETTPGLPTLGDDLTSFMDEALSKSFNSTDFQTAEHHDGSPACEVQDGAVAQRISRKPTRTKSERTLKRHSVGIMLETSVPDERARLHRTPSMDALNDRTDRQSRHFYEESSSEDEDEGDQVDKENGVTTAVKRELWRDSSLSKPHTEHPHPFR